VFLRSGATWVQQAKLTATDGAANDSFGEAVSLSETTVVAGALRDESDSGSANVFVRSGSTWVQQAKLAANDGAPGDGFGDALVVLGDDLVIGAPFDDPSGTYSGSAYLFRRSGVAWTQTTKLVASDGAPGDIFGKSVGISAEHLVIGAPAELGDTDGSAYSYSRMGTGWSSPSKLVAPEATIGDNYGSSVALSAGHAVVGAPYDDGAAGSAYVFRSDQDT
jgi:hypothetical protein